MKDSYSPLVCRLRGMLDMTEWSGVSPKVRAIIIEAADAIEELECYRDVASYRSGAVGGSLSLVEEIAARLHPEQITKAVDKTIAMRRAARKAK